eukprot:86130_1
MYQQKTNIYHHIDVMSHRHYLIQQGLQQQITLITFDQFVTILLTLLCIYYFTRRTFLWYLMAPFILCAATNQLTTLSVPLDTDGYPLEFYVTADATSSGYYFFENEWYKGQKTYYYTNDLGQPRYLFMKWSNGWWWLHNRIGSGAAYKKCLIPTWYNKYKTANYPGVLPCNSGIIIKHCITANQSNDKYIYNGIFNGKWSFKNENNSRFIYYHLGDINATIDPGWKVSDIKGSNTFYGTCNQTNFFACSGLKSSINIYPCGTRDPTKSPTPSPTNSPTLSPTTLPTLSPTIPTI